MQALTYPRKYTMPRLDRRFVLALGLSLGGLAACSDMPTTPDMPAATETPATASDTPTDNGSTSSNGEGSGSASDSGTESSGQPPAEPTPQASGTSPLAGASLYVDQSSNAARQAAEWRSSRPGDAAEMDKLAREPQAIWFGDWNPEPYEWVSKVTREITRSGSLPVYVLYNIPFRDCGSFSAGGAGNSEGYGRWISEIARAIGSERAVVVLEPDAIAGMDCLSPAAQQERLGLIANAIDTLKANGKVSVYVDAGNAKWHSPEAIADRLRKAGVEKADGFALNVSNFLRDSENVSYGSAVSALIGGKHFVVDSSRNGAGPTADLDWCNPQGRALGTRPTTRTGHPLLDAFLWIKAPGESDGECNRSEPSAGKWWADYALGLIKRAAWN